MKIHLEKGSTLEEVAADMLVVCCPQTEIEGEKRAVLQRSDGGKALDKMLDGLLSNVIEQHAFEGKVGAWEIIPLASSGKYRAAVLIGIGPLAKAKLHTWRILGASMAAAAARIRATSAAVVLQPGAVRRLSPVERLQAVTEGIALAGYRFDQFQTENNSAPNPLQTLYVVTPKLSRALLAAEDSARVNVDSTNLARTLVNLPSNVCTPSYLAQQARSIAKAGDMECTVFDSKRISKERMRLLEAVSQGSSQPPAFIHIRYTTKGRARRTIALVGKGVTYDTGGYSLKPTRSMLDMKSDMAGAAAVLAIMQAVAQLKPKTNVDAYIPTCENNVSGSAYKPSDIIASRSGKTIEVVNTDAEGRLILADALDYAAEQKPDLIIDLATLTGGVRYAVGEIYTAILGTDAATIRQIVAAGESAGELMWQLPLEQEYLAGFLGGPADLKNCGKSGASTITGALFLQQFVREIPWVHLDIAESSWSGEGNVLSPKGGTGSPVRSLLRWLTNC